MKGIREIIKKADMEIKWYITAKPYKYIAISLILNLFESLMLVWLILRLKV